VSSGGLVSVRRPALDLLTPGEFVEAALNAVELEIQEDAGIDVFVARQPIFWSDQKAMGYELLYRSNGEVQVAGDQPLETMSSAVLVNALLAMGLRDITDGKVAFINFPRELLVDDMAQLLDPKEVVIELHETVRPDPQVLAACGELVKQGFVLALDDFEFDGEFAPLLEMAQIVKVDVLGKTPDGIKAVVDRLAPFEVQLLAEKVESEEIHQVCMDLGFALFQGFHYLKPETLTKRDLSTESVAVVHLMNLLGDMNVTDRKVEEAFRSDPGLSYKLLRMVNSAALGGRGVTSIEHALRLLGRDPLYRWVSMLLVAEARDGTGVRNELVKSSLFRGRLCELLGDQIRGPSVRGVPGAGTLFLIGLFSRIDILLKIRMEDLFKKVDLSEVAQEALLWRSGVGGQLLKAVEAYEDAKWGHAEAEVADLGMDPGDLPNLYLESIAWAGDRLTGADSRG
jgi:EAL and modified HD-GYP domain-containing signal transduction protein